MSPPVPKRRKRPVAGGALDHSNQRATGNKPRRGRAQAALISDPRFRRRVQHLERFNSSRIVGELLAMLCIEYGCRDDVEKFLDRIVEREDAIRSLGADRWPPLPLHQVPR